MKLHFLHLVGVKKNRRKNFRGKLGEDSLRPSSQCSCGHTCLSKGFSCVHPIIPLSSESLYPEAEKTSTWEMENSVTPQQEPQIR